MLYDVEKIKNQKTRMALYKIRFGKKLTLKDIKGVFSKLSTGYTGSYSWNVMKSK
jgi:hypothetical protein